MKIDKKYFIYGGIALIIIIAFILYRRNLKKNTPAIGTPPPPTGGATSTGGSTSTTTSPTKYKGTDYTKWEKGNKLVAVAPTVNVYKTKSISQANVQDTASKDQFLGKLIFVSGNFAAISYVRTTLGVPYETTGYLFITQAVSQAPNITSIGA